ncbi:MAG: hypothetical protein HY235_22075 [Acidobacteria bacterium]|nr:hypothetical protein [Acidobacteriota bacterium]
MAVCGVAAAAEFSHALHLKLKPECTSCHPGATSSTRIEDNLLPEAQACGSCHKQVAIPQPRSLRLSRFDHAFHLKLGNIAPLLRSAVLSKAYLGEAGDLPSQFDTRNACAGCHHGIEQSTAASQAHFPQMADCLVCHNKIDPPFSCETCHGQDKALKPATHAPDYLDSHTLRSVKQGCAVCHGRRFLCLGCH